MQELIDNVIQWAEDRNLIAGSSPEKQLQKTAEELIELAVAVGRDSVSWEAATYAHEVADGIGDVLVTLIIVTEQLGLRVEDCLQFAYDEIKDRKGKMVNGKFVKEAT